MITDDHFNELDKTVKAAIENPELLSDWENDFCSDFADKLGKYGADIRISDKQHAVFERIKDKLEKEGAL